MRYLVLSSAVALCLAAPAVQADPELAASLRFGLARNLDASENFKRVETSFAVPLRGALSLQFDLSVSKYERITSAAPSGGLHLAYAVNDAWTLGVYTLAEDLRPGNFVNYGIEAAFEDGPLSVQAYAAHVEDLNSANVGFRGGVDLEYGLDQWALLAGAHMGDDGSAQERFAYVGAGYRLRNGMRLDATLGQKNGDETVIGLGLTIDLGRGATFGRRDWHSALK